MWGRGAFEKVPPSPALSARCSKMSKKATFPHKSHFYPLICVILSRDSVRRILKGSFAHPIPSKPSGKRGSYDGKIRNPPFFYPPKSQCFFLFFRHISWLGMRLRRCALHKPLQGQIDQSSIDFAAGLRISDAHYAQSRE